MANLNNKHVLMWGNDDNGCEPIVAAGLEGFNVKQVVCALGTAGSEFTHAYILTQEGRVFQWGPSSDWKSVPHNSRQITSGSLIEEPVAQIASGHSHFAAITKEGELYTWGCGKFGELGHGSKVNLNNPKLVEALNGIHIIQVLCWAYGTAALSQDGTIYTFGSNAFLIRGQQLLPTKLENLPPIKFITGFCFHVAAVCHRGHVYTWGDGTEGQLGHADNLNSLTPKKLATLDKEHIVRASCGKFHTAALTKKGKVYSFGDGENGKLGHNGIDNQTTPKLVDALQDLVISSVACGRQHSCFLSDAGELYVCGKLAPERHVLTPQKVTSLQMYIVKNVCAFDCYTICLATRRTTPSGETPLHTSLRNMVNNQECADIIFQIGNERVFAHKAFLVERSEFFQKMISSGMRESSDNVIRLGGIDKSTLLLILEYLYTGHVYVPGAALVDLHTAADMYGLGGLKQTCKESLLDCLTFDNAAQMLLKAAGTAGAEELSELCFNFVVKNIKAVLKADGMSVLAKEDGDLMLKITQQTKS